MLLPLLFLKNLQRLPMPNNQPNPVIRPTQKADRYVQLDVLRGFALLGILVMNIQSFSMIDAAYLNPTAYGDLSGANRLIWILSHVLADSKFMALFSLMFGASVLLFTDRIEARGLRPWKRYYLRTFWLIVFGMLHAYLFWHGDILVTYGLCALVVVFFRKARPGVLLVLGLLVVSVASLLYGFFQWSMQHWSETDMVELARTWAPSLEEIDEIMTAYLGGWRAQMSQRVPASVEVQTFYFLIYSAWRAGGLMLVGMALYRWGVLTGQRSQRFYTGCLLAGLLVGIPLVSVGVYRNFAAEWAIEYSFFAGTQFNFWGSLLISLGYIGLIMLACLRGWASRLLHLLAKVGRTALSNYILQTVLCTVLFYGHGFGLFGKVPRSGQFGIVISVWVFQILLTHLWLQKFRFGPLEWLWRSLTYWKLQPMRVGGQEKDAG